MTREYAASLLLTLSVVALASPAAALTQKECSEKYQAAKSAGTLADKSWNDFRKTECGRQCTCGDDSNQACTCCKSHEGCSSC
jgi:hypothetical protein